MNVAINHKYTISYWISLGVLSSAVILLLMLPFARLGLMLEIDYNEGVNVFNSLKAVSGQLFYDARTEWTLINYPPLSFYIIGYIGKYIGNPLIVGRYISFISLLFIAFSAGHVVRKLGGRVYDSVFAGVICLGFFTAFATHYVGMNDPQMFGHVFMLSGLLLYLKRPTNNIHIFTIVFLCSIGLYIKHTLIPIPLAMTIDLFFRSRRLFLKWVIFSVLTIGIFLFITNMIAGSDFLNQLLMKRNYSIQKLIQYTIRHIGFKLLIPLIVTAPWVFSAFKNNQNRIISIYLTVSLTIGIYALGGAGTDINMLFDVFIGVSIAAGMLLFYSQTKNQSAYKIMEMFKLILPIILCLSIFAAITTKIIRNRTTIDFKDGVWHSGTYNELKIMESSFLDDAEFLSSYPDSILCENTLMCYFAKKSLIYKPFDTSERIIAGNVDEGEVLNWIESGYFKIIQLNRPLKQMYLNDLRYITIQKRYYNDRFTENFKRALGKHYILIRQTINGAFYKPKVEGT